MFIVFSFLMAIGLIGLIGYKLTDEPLIDREISILELQSPLGSRFLMATVAWGVKVPPAYIQVGFNRQRTEILLETHRVSVLARHYDWLRYYRYIQMSSFKDGTIIYQVDYRGSRHVLGSLKKLKDDEMCFVPADQVVQTQKSP